MLFLQPTPTIAAGILSVYVVFWLPAMADGLSLGSVLEELHNFGRPHALKLTLVGLCNFFNEELSLSFYFSFNAIGAFSVYGLSDYVHEMMERPSRMVEIKNGDEDQFDEELKDALDSASESIRNAVLSTASLYHPSTDRGSLGSVSILLGDKWILEAQDAQLTPPSRVTLTDLTLDLLYPSMKMSLSMGDLNVDGAFQAHSPALAPVQGQFTINLKELKARGHVGVTMSEDSLLLSAFDLKYEPADIAINVTRSTGEVDVYPASAVAPGLADALLPRVFPLLDAQVKRTVGEALVEQSISERLGDDELASAYLQHVQRVEFLANKVMTRVLEQGPGAVPRGVFVLPEQRLGTSEWVMTGPLSLKGVSLTADGPVSVAREPPGSSPARRQVLLYAKLRALPFQMEADWSASVGSPHAGGLRGQCSGGFVSVRLELGPGPAPVQLQPRGVDLVDLSVPQVNLNSELEHPLRDLLSGCVSNVLDRSFAPVLREALVKGCSP